MIRDAAGAPLGPLAGAAVAIATLVAPAMATVEPARRGVVVAVPMAGDPGYSVDVWRTDDGLPNDNVRGLIQTRDGNLWIGTNAGLARFDGVKFTVLDRSNTPALPSDQCGPLFEDSTGALWIGTIGGSVTRMEGNRTTTFGRPEGAVFQYVLSFLEDPRGRIVIGTDTTPLLWENGRLRHLDPNAGAAPAQWANPTFIDDAGRVCLYDRSGRISRIENGILREISSSEAGIPAGVPKPAIPYRAPSGLTWIRQGDPSHLWRVEDGLAEEIDLSLESREDRVARLLEASDGALWVGLTRSGLRCVREGRAARIGPEHGLPPAPVTAIVEDREGSIWVGTTAGLARVRRRTFAAITPASGLVEPRCWAVLEDSRGDIWVGTDTVLERIRRDHIDAFPPREGGPAYGIVSLAEDRDGRVWFGTTTGLWSYADGRFSAVETVAGRPYRPNVRALFIDRAGRLWAGTTMEGLNLFEGGRLTRRFTKADGLGSNWVRFLYEDSRGDLWICTTGGLSRLSGGRITTFTSRDGLAGDEPLAVQEDARGALWIGTYARGLCRFENGRFATIGTAQGLPDDTVLRIILTGGSATLGSTGAGRAAGSAEELWISSPKGIYRASIRDLHEVADGRAPSVPVVRYGKGDGLPSADCGGGTQPSGWRSRDGRLWFPTSEGIAVVDPAALSVNRRPPPVRIERLVHDQVVKDFPIFTPIGAAASASTSSASSSILRTARPSASDPPAAIEIPAGTRAIEIHYTALSLRAPEKVRFRYRLEGFDPGWVEAGPRRIAYYTNVPPGRYRFRVLAANDDGVWNETGASTDLRALPFFWQTGWFWTLCGAAALGALWGLHLLRLRQTRARYAAVLAERGRIARELHDTIAQGFTGVSMQLEAVAARLDPTAGEARENLDRARLLVRSSLADARRSVRDLRPLALEASDLVASLQSAARALADGTAVRIDVKAIGRRQRLSPAIESQLLRVGQEALTNAVRHAGCRTVRVEVTFRGGQVRLSVEDDGTGFAGPPPASSEGSGLGIPGMRERMAQVGGQLVLDSEPGRGTRIVATAPADPGEKGNRMRP